MKNLYHLPTGDDVPRVINAIIEVPKNSSNKYEYDAELGIFRLDRVLHSPLHYPGGYGFIPSTLADDGDPLDVLVLTDEPTMSGVLMTVRPVGFLEMSDEKGRDQKILAVPTNDPRYDGKQELDDVPQHRLREIEHFFDIYKELEGKHVQVDGWHSRQEAHELISYCVKNFAASLQVGT